MADFDNTNKGVLFPKTPESDRHPNYSGEINVEGKEYIISAWNKVSKAGNNYKSISITQKSELPQNYTEQSSNVQKEVNKHFEDNQQINLDEIPF